MKLHNGLNGTKLRSKLKAMLGQERQNWPLVTDFTYNRRNEEFRDAMTRWLLVVHHKLGYSPNTFDLSVSIADRFLLCVRAQPKYLKCIAISSYFLAAKCMEEDEIILATSELVDISKCGCSVAEVLRMERVILSKLKWAPLSKTVLDFVHVLYGLLMIKESDLIEVNEADRQLKSLIAKLYICLCKYQVRSFLPSTLAVALISIELGCHTRNWLAITILLQKEIELENVELIRCREVLSRILCRSSSIEFGRPVVAVWKGGTKPCKRKVEQAEVDDDVYEGIKRLYGEDNAAVHDSMLSCGSQAVLTAIVAAASSAIAAI